MAATMRAQRAQEFKNLYNRDIGNFNSKYAALYGFMGMGWLSLRQCRWIEQKIREMQSMFIGEAEHLRRIDELWERNEKAKARFIKRMEKREAEKLKKKGWRFGKPPGYVKPPKIEPEVTPTPVTSNDPADIWDIPFKPKDAL